MSSKPALIPEYAIVALFMKDSARVSAPAICVVVLDESSFSVVDETSSLSDKRRSRSIRAKGRYLFASLIAFPSLSVKSLASTISVSSPEEDVDGRGYSHTAR